MLASSDQPEEAQRLVAYLTSPEAQERLAESSALEYAVGTGVASADGAAAAGRASARPTSTPARSTRPLVTELMQEVGLL